MPRISEVLSKDPTTNDIPNKGVADIDQDATLRWELQNFVCEGQYESGLDRILRSYLRNHGREQQPGVWVSGFYGSGKSHLVKVLAHLWVDTEFDDGASAQGLANLPMDIQDSLKEIATIGKRGAGLFAAAGELEFARPLRREVLAILFAAAGLPQEYPYASCYMWLRDEEVLDAVRDSVERSGKDFHKELRRMYASPVFAEALMEAMPGIGSSPGDVFNMLRAQFPSLRPKDEITEEQMIDAMEDLLMVDGQMPCTLIVLDELQQYIGDEGERALDVQLVTQACTKHFTDKLMFVGTGQSALSATPKLQKIRDRFYLPIELADTDIETVTRKIVLAKKPDKQAQVENLLTEFSGEIDRQLRDTRIAPRPEDEEILVADYPILPVRRRFWEQVLRAVDKAGTTGQLRTQLRIAHEAVRELANEDLGAIVPADFIYDQQSTALIQSAVLLPDIHEEIVRHRDGTVAGELKSRLCALCWLIGQLPRGEGADIGVRATPEMLADLLVDDLRDGNTELRERVPELLDELEQAGQLMLVEDEYLIQTREGAEWLGEFKTQYASIRNDAGKIAEVRSQLLRKHCGEELRSVKLIQGASKVARDVAQHFGDDAPEVSGSSVPVWIRDGWEESEKTVQRDAREGGSDSPVVYVFLPKGETPELRRDIAEWKAAEATLGLKGVPTTDEGKDARTAMETRATESKRRVEDAVSNIIDAARVFQGGGSEVTGLTLSSAVEQAAERALSRLYPEFDTADSAKWSQVIKQARDGAADCLVVLGHQGEIEDHPVCSGVLDFVGPAKKGREVRRHFRDAPYGWSQDAIDGALAALVVGDYLSAQEHGQEINLKALDQTKIGVADFRCVSVKFTTEHRIAVRKLLQDAGISFKPKQETSAIPRLLTHMQELAEKAGGDPPAPATPSMVHIEDLAKKTGNELGVAVYEMRERLAGELETWRAQAEGIDERMPRWDALQSMLRYAEDLTVAEDIEKQAMAVKEGRRLLEDPDPVAPLCDTLADALRDALNDAFERYQAAFEAGMEELEKSKEWDQLSESQRKQIISDHKLDAPEKPKISTESDLLDALERVSVGEWNSRVDALPQRFSEALLEAARLLKPEAVPVKLPSRTLSTTEEVEEYVDEVRQLLLSHINSDKTVVIR